MLECDSRSVYCRMSNRKKIVQFCQHYSSETFHIPFRWRSRCCLAGRIPGIWAINFQRPWSTDTSCITSHKSLPHTDIQCCLKEEHIGTSVVVEVTRPRCKNMSDLVLFIAYFANWNYCFFLKNLMSRSQRL